MPLVFPSKIQLSFVQPRLFWTAVNHTPFNHSTASAIPRSKFDRRPALVWYMHIYPYGCRVGEAKQDGFNRRSCRSRCSASPDFIAIAGVQPAADTDFVTGDSGERCLQRGNERPPVGGPHVNPIAANRGPPIACHAYAQA